MKLNEKTMLAVCDALSAGLSYSGAALSVGIAPRTLWFWIKQSQSGDEQYMLDFLGERVQFARAVSGARRIMLHNARSEFERRSYLGHDEPVFFGGMPTWRPDPRTVGWSEDEREAFGFRRDGLLEIDGRVVQNTIHHEPPVAATLRVLEVAFPNEYIPQTKSTVQTTVNGIVGVAWAKPMTGPPEIPPAPVPPPQLEILPEPELSLEELGEDEPDDLADDLPELRPEAIANVDRVLGVPYPPAAPATPAPEPEPVMIRSATPPEYAPEQNPLIKPRVGRPLSDLERDLLTRASAIPGALNRKA